MNFTGNQIQLTNQKKGFVIGVTDGSPPMPADDAIGSGYWIRFTHTCCPVCSGNSHEYQERIYNEPKPEDVNERHIYEESYDNCIEWSGLYGG